MIIKITNQVSKQQNIRIRLSSGILLQKLKTDSFIQKNDFN